MRSLLISALIVVSAAAADPPERVHIVVSARSDAAPFWSAYLMELRRPEARNWELRWSRIAPANGYCPRIDVKSDSRRVSEDAVKHVFETVNPCTVKQKQISRVYPKDRLVDLMDHPVDYWVVSACNGEARILESPDLHWKKYESLRKRGHIAPRIQHLYWDLAKAAGYGSRSPFADLDDDEDLRLQRQGEAIVPELLTGRYDAGLKDTWAKILQGYAGARHPEKDRPKPVLVREASSDGVELIGPEIEYPPLAKAARIQGRVSVFYTVEPRTGAIRIVEGKSPGHPLLVRAAEASLQTWRVTNHQGLGAGPFTAVIEYGFDAAGCQPKPAEPAN